MLAFRALNKSNIEFAYDAFQEIKKEEIVVLSPWIYQNFLTLLIIRF
ncbi:hypothetical protein A225_3995 [Klebsiella michiganensis E718]|nr:hypothetical protein A225_3995 [Klebsiella michiganensis E718]